MVGDPTGQSILYVYGSWLWPSLLASHCIPGDVGTLHPARVHSLLHREDAGSVHRGGLRSTGREAAETHP